MPYHVSYTIRSSSHLDLSSVLPHAVVWPRARPCAARVFLSQKWCGVCPFVPGAGDDVGEMLRCYVNVRFVFLLPLLSRTFPLHNPGESSVVSCYNFSLKGSHIHFSLCHFTSLTVWPPCFSSAYCSCLLEESFCPPVLFSTPLLTPPPQHSSASLVITVTLNWNCVGSLGCLLKCPECLAPSTPWAWRLEEYEVQKAGSFMQPYSYTVVAVSPRI